MWENGYLAFAPETRYGSPNNPTSYFLPCRAGAITTTNHPYQVLAQGMTLGQQTFGLISTEVSGQVAASPNLLRLLLPAMLNDVRPVQLASGVAEYTFRPAPGRRSYTVEIADRYVVRQAVGTYLTSVMIQTQVSNQVMTNFTGVARGVRSRDTRVTPIFDAEEAAWWNKVSFEVNGVAETNFSGTSLLIQAPMLSLDAQASAGAVANYLQSAPPQTQISVALANPSSAWVSYTEQQIPINFAMILEGTTITGSYKNMIRVDVTRVKIDQAPIQFAAGTGEALGYRVKTDGYGNPRDPRGTKVTVTCSGSV